VQLHSELVLDECHLLHGDLTGYVWGQSTIRIEVPITNEKDRQTYFGALNYQSVVKNKFNALCLSE
jgi:hypothetical protein